MGANKPKAASSRAARWIRLLLRPQTRGLVLSALIIGAALSAAIYGWNRWGNLAVGAPEYVLTPEQIEITPRPAWIHADVKAEVVRSAALTRVDLLDRNLVERIAHAFALHPWVAKVVRVEKRNPARVRVELVYRRPVAAVEIANRGDAGLLFVDENSVLLPSGDFAPSQAKDFLRIAGSTETPAGYGAAWGSERVAGAARLAAVWGDRWHALGLYRIAAVQSSSGKWEFELRTKGDVRVIWGAAPGNESTREPTPQQKIAALQQYVHDKGSLEREGGPRILDLRELAGKSAATASRPNDAPR
jgi:hypothetical protein